MGEGTGRLAGKRILITGASGALGSDLARACGAQGARLVVTGRSRERLEPLVRGLRAEGVPTVPVAADFACNADADRLGVEAEAAFGGIDVVVLSGQPADPCQGMLLDLDDAIIAEQQQVLVWGPFRTVRKLVPGMIARGSGSIIAITSSTGDEQPVPGYGAYGLAKGTLWRLTRQMAAEWGRYGIRANALQPGHIATGDDDQARALEAALATNGALSRNAMGRVGRNHECMGALIYLASDESSYTSGQRIAVNGGRF